MSHGDAPSRLHSELARAYVAIASHPYLGVGVRSDRRFELSVGYFVFYRVRVRRREIVILRLVHHSELYR